MTRTLLVLAWAAATPLGAVCLADDDWWEDWQEAMEDAREDAEDDWEDAWEDAGRPVGPRWQRRHPVYYDHHGYDEGYGHRHYYEHKAGPGASLRRSYVSIDAAPQTRHTPPAGARWFEDLAWYEGDSPVPEPLVLPPQPASSVGHSHPTFGSPRPPFTDDGRSHLEPTGRLEPIPDETFNRTY